MSRKKKGVKPRKPVIRPVASRKVELPQVEISVSDEQRRACDEMTRMAQEWGHYDKPTFWQRVCSWCRDNPVDAVLIGFGLGGSVLLVGVVAVLG